MYLQLSSFASYYSYLLNTSEDKKEIAHQAIRSFIMANVDHNKGEHSLFYIYHDIGKCEVNGINVVRDLRAWGALLERCLTISETDYLQEIIEKVVQDVKYEMHVRHAFLEKSYYDATLRGEIIIFLKNLGLTQEKRHATYSLMPGFQALPREDQTIIFLGKRYLPIIEEEFSPGFSD